MSSDSEDSENARAKDSEALTAIARELRQLLGLGASFFRAAAARSGMTVTDLQVIDILESTAPMTAGQLADLTGLTTGAITGMLNRLEESGLVQRVRDPGDGRRVIVRLASPPADRNGTFPRQGTGPLFDELSKAWEELASQYGEAQLAAMLDFLKRSNVLSRQELVRLRTAPQDEEGDYSSPLGDLTSARLVIPAGVSTLSLRAIREMKELYQAHFEGVAPTVSSKDGVVTIRYPRRLWILGGMPGTAQVTLNAALPWWIAIQGGASDITADLTGLDLSGLEVKGGMSMISVQLPIPTGLVPIHLSGGASTVTVKRPADVPARVHLKGWASQLEFDQQSFSNLGSDVRLQSPDYEGTTPGYDIEIASSVSMIIITTN
jgi:DNA-binding MarR family transcriptional regulator